MDDVALQAARTALGVGTSLTSALALLILAIVALIKGWPALRKIHVEGEAGLRDDLMSRVVSLEGQLGAMQHQMESERARHQSEMAIMRHRLNNETSCFDMLLELMEVAPDKAAESLARIKEMRAQKALEIAVEKGAAKGLVP